MGKVKTKQLLKKIEAKSGVKFAVILLTHNDEGKSINESDLQPRARQNIIFNMGYFIL